MNDHPLLILGKVTAQFERLDDLLAQVKTDDLDQRQNTWLQIEDTQRHIDANLERLAAIYLNPLHQIQEIATEHRNAYVGVVKELINEKPGRIKNNDAR